MNTTPKKIRILILDPADFVGGAEYFAIDLLNNTQDKQFSIEVACNNNQKYLELLNKDIKTHIIRLPKITIKSIKSIKNAWNTIKILKKIIKNENIDILQTNSVRAHIIGSFIKKSTNIKLIWFVHDFTFKKYIFRFFAKYPDKIICCSESVKDAVINVIPKNYHSKLSVIPNGINTKCISKACKEKKKTSPNPKIGIIGRIDSWKGQKYFILAAEQLLKKHPNAEFYIIGEPNNLNKKNMKYYRSLIKLIRRKKIDRNVFFTGFKKDIYKEIQNLDIVVHASIDPEPFGRVVIEAMAMKKVVIATAHGGPLEIIKHRENGFLVTPKNTDQIVEYVEYCINHPKKSEQIGNAAQKTVLSKYTIERIVDMMKQEWKNENSLN